MIDYESYQNNLDATDKNDIGNVNVTKRVIYSGSLKKLKHINADDVKKCTRPLAATAIGLNNTALTDQGIPENLDLWTEHDTEERFLISKPTCYLILGKPGSGAYSLGEAIAKKYRCIHLCPKTVLMDEIEQGSPTGKCMIYNMKQKKVIQSNTILSIMKKKLESAIVKHRGYVVSGLPLVTSNISSHHFTNTLFSEEALEVVNDLLLFDVIANIRKRKPKKQKASSHPSLSSDVGEAEEVEEEIEEEQEEEHLEEEEEAAATLPKYLIDICENIIVSEQLQMLPQKVILLEQLNEIINLPMHPDIIVYLTCPDKDLVTKKNHKYYSYSNNVYTFDQFTINSELELRWPTKCTLSDYVRHYDAHTFNPKYNCKHPINYEKNSIKQMCNYKQYVLQFIEDKLKDFQPKQILRLSAHSSVHEMMHQITERLTLLSTKPVIIPEPLYIEDPPEEMEDFWSLVGELNIIKNGTLTFSRYPSLWYNRCPVQLVKRRTVQGRPKFAVSLFKHVYLLSSLNHFVLFCKNPRPYLKLNFLEPICRVVVTGTKSSGKTMISKCLSWIFDAPIISYDNFLQNEREKKHGMYSKTILSEIIATIEDARLLAWQKTESDRISNLDVWVLKVSNELKMYVPILIEYLKLVNRSVTEESTEKVQEEELSAERILLDSYETLRMPISFLPFLDDVDECLRVLRDKSLVTYAPLNLKTPTKKPDTPVIGDEDVTIAIENYIVANELQKEIEPTFEELMTELNSIIFKIDEDSQELNNVFGKYIIDGFPSEPELWDYFSDANLLPDNTIALVESREIEPVLLENYTKIENCPKNYQERFVMAQDPLIITKLQTTTLSDTKDIDVQIIVYELMVVVLDTIFTGEDENEEKSPDKEGETNPDLITTFTAAVEKFRDDWDSVKLKLEENYKSFIEVQVENQTDIQIIEEVLLKLRQSYCLMCEESEDEQPEPMDEEDESPKDMLTYNDPRYLCETGTYCPVTFYDHNVLWEGNPEFCIKHNNKIHYFAKEECRDLFQKDVTCYQSYNRPMKHLPPLRICVVGCIGSGKSTISKLIAKELGLLHIDFSEIINDFLIPKHFKKVGRQYENIFADTPIDEEGVVEFQMDEENENLVSDILSNETELRRMVYNYFERGSPILSVLMQRILKKLWFEPPFKEGGFVIDGYPRLPSDTEDMVAYNCVPDLVIELESNSETAVQRLSQKMYKTWKSQLIEAKKNAKIKLDKENQNWMEFITKTVVAKLILEDILNDAVPAEEINDLSTGSAIIEPNPQGSMHVDMTLYNMYNATIEEYPAPIDQNEWEKADEARERIDARIEGIFEVEDEGLQSLKDVLLEQRIKLFSFNSTKPTNKLLRLMLFKLTNLRNRNESFFEQTYILNYDIADILLSQGYYFFSKFERMCPVYMYENPKTISNAFKIRKRRNEVFPVIHRANIYFIFGNEHLTKFRINPLKYIRHDNINLFKEYPLTIGIIGASKSGKSELARKLAKRYGLMCISKGKALRHMLETLHWTELSTCMKNALCEGNCVKLDHIIKAVQTVAIDHRTATYGFVFDGFPESAPEAMELLNIGLYPSIIIDISGEVKNVLENSQNEIYYDMIKYKPPYSAPFIEYRYGEWSKRKYNVRNWIQDDIQNILFIDGRKSKWEYLQDATEHIDEVSPQIYDYLINVTKTVVPAHFMGISNALFEKRMSSFMNLCPLCLRDKVLKHSGFPVEKKGVVQFENRFYWVCADHFNLVLKYPDYLSADKVEIPEVPAVVQTVNLTFVYEKGICIVTYAENLPSQKVVSGSNKYAASFHGKTYLFCSSKCLDRFLAKPHMYYDIEVFKDNIFAPLSLEKLPNIGYLEQTLAKIITDACCLVNVVRPKYPGLSLTVSALLYIALYLKTHNPRIDKDALPLFEKIARIYDARCKLVTYVGLRLRSIDNPFANYPKCCHSLKGVDSGTVRKPSSFTNDVASSSNGT